MFDTDAEGKINLKNEREKKGKLMMNKGASTGRWTHTREAWHKKRTRKDDANDECNVVHAKRARCNFCDKKFKTRSGLSGNRY